MSKKTVMRKSYPDEEEEGDDEDEYEVEEDKDEEEVNKEVETKTINVKVQAAVKGAKVVIFKLERDIELRWLMVRYCDKVGMSHGCYTTKFMFNGVRLRDTDTPLQLNMCDNDVIYFYPNYPEPACYGDPAVYFGTVCIRMHKKRDMLLRVTRHEPLLHQLQHRFSNDVAGKDVSTCFLKDGYKLTEGYTMDNCRMVDGDIIDAFNFEESNEEEEGDDEDENEVEEDKVEEEVNKEVETKTINVKVQAAVKGAKVEIFKLERDIELRWLMVRYCDKVDQSYGRYGTKFMFNGVKLRDTDTPLQLNMCDNDVIYFYPNYLEPACYGDRAVYFGTVCIRMHKKRDMLLRVTRHEPLLHQLQHRFSNDVAGKDVSTCLLHNGYKLTKSSTMDSCRMEDGDIIDAFNFEESSSSLSIITPDIQLLKVKVKGNEDGKLYSFNVRRSTRMGNLVHKYAEMNGLQLHDFHLVFEGRRIFQYDKTVGDSRLFDGCLIHSYRHLTGGCLKPNANY